MDFGIAAMLFGAGVVGGIVNAIAGGATLLTFPVMLAAGLPPVVANASNAVAVLPGHLVAGLADRSQLPAFDGRLVAVVAVAITGGALGAVLLLVTPERFFTMLVPALIGLATLIFATGRSVQAEFSHRVSAQGQWIRTALLLPTSVYGGYFGAGLGVMLLAVLTVTGGEGARAINARKNLLASAASLATAAIFAVQGVIHWPETLTMLAGAVCGGVLGGRLATLLSPPIVRSVVVMIGISMTVIYAWRYWF
jgi:uncharacterized membrane protein YfcA